MLAAKVFYLNNFARTLHNAGWSSAFPRAVLFFALFLLNLTLNLSSAKAAQITMNLVMLAVDERVSVKLTNIGKDSVKLENILLQLEDENYEQKLDFVLEPAASRDLDFKVRLPIKDGTYPLIGKLRYLNNNKRLSMVLAGYFDLRNPQRLQEACAIQTVPRGHYARLFAPLYSGYRTRLVLPDEIRLINQGIIEDRQYFDLQNNEPSFDATYDILMLLQTQPDSFVQAVKICKLPLSMQRFVTMRKYRWGLICAWLAMLPLIGSFMLKLFQGRTPDAEWRKIQKERMREELLASTRPLPEGAEGYRMRTRTMTLEMLSKDGASLPPLKEIVSCLQINELEALLGSKREAAVPAGWGEEPEKIRVKVPPGIKSGAELQITRGWDRIKVKILVVPDPWVCLQKSNIVLTVPVRVDEVIAGGKLTVPSRNGSVEAEIMPGTDVMNKLCLPGLGIDDVETGLPGDPLLQLRIELPQGKTRREN